MVKKIVKKAVKTTVVKKKAISVKKAVALPKKSAVKTVKSKAPIYNEKSIKTLDGIIAIKKKKSMYVGNGPTALLQLPQEIVSNSVDEAIGGHCNKIDLIIEKDGGMSVSDNGRGIPVGLVKHRGKMIGAIELACTGVHSGGKMDTDAYSVSAGTNGQQSI